MGAGLGVQAVVGRVKINFWIGRFGVCGSFFAVALGLLQGVVM